MGFKLFINGKWSGGTFGSKAEAEAAAKKLRKSADDKVEVLAKGGAEKPPKK